MRSEKHGGLLLEVLIGMGIFATALLLAFGIFPNSSRASVRARNYAQATALAKNSLEQELNKGYAAVVDAGPDPVRLDIMSNGVPVSIEFQVQIIVDEVETTATGLVNRKAVQCVVTWQEGEVTKDVVYETWITN